ncbi:DUF2079 domain-containing protein [Streptomyces cocklensis]|uniref:Predicted membrane protein n=1 Tax=Actinacidiphila cocklensis TaxID=887465 RepID=A0A9W4E0W2_9ACTN|nr:DUF2079 domain-containing protein [Actinacidiphila cocklensis]MDD1057321.1 DUF2079 domain-containing protein [Actinacidiphila cocklensis]WSX79142.1 DUF2079 domain-containing protein [Streptomyces sp. NBC_00899]CAG6399399.1 Predicted membrane protein [Actinacidiphila cocklensis]
MDGDRDSAEAVLPAQESGPRDIAPPVRVHPAAATTAPVAAAGRRWRLPARLDPWLLATGFLALYAALSLSRYRRMETMSWDLGIFEQAVRGYAHLHAPVADLKGPGFDVLGDHFSPIIALIAPLYRLFPTSATLLVAQALLFALSVVPVTGAAARLLGRGRGLAVGAAYGLSWGVQRAVDFDFHEIAFAVPLLAFSLAAVLRRRWRTAMGWAVSLVLVKEDMGAAIVMIGAVVWLRAGHDTVRGTKGGGYVRTWALGLAAFGAVASAWEVSWLIPAFHGPGYDALNHINGDGTLTSHVPPATALRTVLWILLPAGGLLALRSPLLLVVLPTLGWRFLSYYPENWGTAWHYNAVLMPVVFLAAVDCAAVIGAPGRGRRGPAWLRSWVRALPAMMLGAALALCTQLPVAGLTHRDAYRVDGPTRAAKKALAEIPDGATVEANVGPLSRLVRRTTVYWVGQTGGLAPDYLAFENRSGWLQDPAGYALQLHPEARYSLVADAGGYLVLRRE